MIVLLLIGILGLAVGLMSKTRLGMWTVVMPMAVYNWYCEVTAIEQADANLINLVLVFNYAYLLGLLACYRPLKINPLKKHHYYLLAFLLFYFGSYAYARFHGISFRSFLTQASFMMMGVAVGVFASPKSYVRALSVTLALSVLSILLSVFYEGNWWSQSALEYSPLSFDLETGERRYGLFPYLTFGGALLATGSIAATAAILRQTRERAFLKIFIIATLGAFLVTYVYTSQFRVMLVSAIAVALVWPMVVSKRKIFVFLVFSASILLLVLLFSDLSSVLSKPFLGRKTLAAGDIRLDVNSESLKIFSASPLIGHGFLTNGPLFTEMANLGAYGWAIQGSHSAHMIVLTEVGLVGIALWIFALYASLRAGYRACFASNVHYAGSNANLVTFFTLTAVLVAQFFHGIMYDPLVWLLLAWSYKIPDKEGTRVGTMSNTTGTNLFY